MKLLAFAKDKFDGARQRLLGMRWLAQGGQLASSNFMFMFPTARGGSELRMCVYCALCVCVHDAWCTRWMLIAGF